MRVLTIDFSKENLEKPVIPEPPKPVGICRAGEVELASIYEKRHICLKCVKLRVNRNTSNLVSSCLAFSDFCFNWPENEKTLPWEMKCFGFCGKESDWMDTLDEIHSYLSGKGFEAFPDEADRRLNSGEMMGLKELYYEETHPKLSGPAKNESCGSTCKIIKKNPLLDGDMKGWNRVGNINMSTFNAIESNKEAKRAEAKKLGVEDKSKELKGARKPSTGKSRKESKTTDTTVIIGDVKRENKRKKRGYADA